MNGPIFVFGSNLAGRHGKGAALWARQHRGAIYGQGQGLQGQSYAIPTKDYQLRTLPLETIHDHVDEFIIFARSRSVLTFQLTPIRGKNACSIGKIRRTLCQTLGYLGNVG